MSGLSKGDEVVTNGGMIGKVAKVSDDFVTITLAEGIDSHFQKAAVASVLPKGTIKSI
jgi:preprotein translocase subunit YajC